MPITIINPICEFDDFDCIVEAKCNQINCSLARLGKASVEYNTNRVPQKGEKQGWFASNLSEANKKLLITATGPFISGNDRQERIRTLVTIPKSCLDLAHDKGCASIKIPMLSSLVYVEEDNILHPAEFSEVELFHYHDAVSILSDECNTNKFIGYDVGDSIRTFVLPIHNVFGDNGDASIFLAICGSDMLVTTPSYLEGEKKYVYCKEF